MGVLRGAVRRRRNVLLILLFFFVSAATIRLWGRFFFPLSYRELVEQYSHAQQLDPLFVTAMIREESSFDPGAVSQSGALGLMQIMPETGAWIADQLDEEFTPARLFEPGVSIRFGSWYLAFLLSEFEGNAIKALAAYNAGDQRVREWSSSGIWNGDLATLERLPFSETRRYVIKIMRSYRIYRFLYSTGPSGDSIGRRPPFAPQVPGGLHSGANTTMVSLPGCRSM